jgi:hypothetical protein
MKTRTCMNCNADISNTHGHTKYCSRSCRSKVYYSENREAVIQRTTEYAKNNREAKRIAVRKHYYSEKGYQANKEKYQARRIKNMYGLSVEEYNELIKNGCEVCGSFEKLCVDHDHSCCPTEKTCGKCIRGILCRQCNLAEGHIGSDAEKAFKLYQYILNKPCKRMV